MLKKLFMIGFINFKNITLSLYSALKSIGLLLVTPTPNKAPLNGILLNINALRMRR